jgi:hypothetical protein
LINHITFIVNAIESHPLPRICCACLPSLPGPVNEAVSVTGGASGFAVALENDKPAEELSGAADPRGFYG